MVTGLEDKGRGHKSRDVGGFQKLEKKGKETDCPLEALEIMQSN